MRFRPARLLAGAASGIGAAALLWSCSGGTEPTSVPRRVVLESGADQTTPAGRPLATPLVIRVLGDHDRPVPNALVAVTVGRGAGGTTYTSGTSGSDGRVTLDPAAGPHAGDQVIEVKVGTLPPVLASLHTVAGAAETVAPYVGDAQRDTVGRLLAAPLVAVVRDTFGNVVPSAPVVWAIRSGAGSLSGAESATSGEGIAQVRYTLGPVPRVDTIEVSITTAHGKASALFTALALAPTPSGIVLQSGGSQDAVAGATFAVAPTFRVVDAQGHPLAGVGVSFAASAGGAVSPERAMSDSSGIVRVASWRASTRAGTDTLIASSAGVKQVVLGAVHAGAPARLFVKSGIRDTIESGTVIGPRVVVIVTDSAGNPVADSGAARTVTTSIASGVGRLARQVTATTTGDSAVFDSLVVSGGGAHVLRFATAGLIAAASKPIYFTVHPVALAVTPHVAIVDSGTTFTPTLTISDSVGVVAGAQVRWRSGDSTVATVDTAGRTGAQRRGESVVSVRSVYESARRDSALVVVTAPGAPVLVADLDRFSFPRDTTVTLTISVDARTGPALGSATAAFFWNPAMFTYVSSTPATGAPMLAINDADAASGSLRFAFADASGRSARTDLLHVTLRATGAATGSLAFSASQVSRADDVLTRVTAMTTAVVYPVVIP